MAGRNFDKTTEQKLLGNAPGRVSSAPASSSFVGTSFIGNIGEKRYLWTARAFAVITAISICCNIVLMLTVVQIVPLYRIEPFLLSFQNKEEQVYNIIPIRENMEDKKAITETFVREYILLRSSFTQDVSEMEARWLPGGSVQEMSSTSLYTEFLEKTAKRALELIRSKSLIRTVRILTVNELSNGLWQVEYETKDMSPSSPVQETNYWTASMRIMYRHKVVKYGERLKNPIGFTVTEYALRHNKVQ